MLLKHVFRYMNYIFYDTETTGLSSYFDQILQFAAILTDANFNEIDRYEIRCRLQPHILANPGAMHVTNISVADLTNPNLPTHYEMMKDIRKTLLSWQPAVILGQNTLKFDEPMLRSGFYQSLLPPYLTNTNGNMRMDSLPILQAISLLEPNVVNFPLNAKGNKSFKLDSIAPANGFNHQNAHEAMSDVEATISMCRLVKNNAPDIWGNFLRNADKFRVLEFTKRKHPYALVRSFFGKVSVSSVATIDINPDNRNEIIALNLSNCPIELFSLSDDEIRSKMARSPNPFLTIRANAMPSVWSFGKFPELANYTKQNLQTLNERAKLLDELEGLKARLRGLYLDNKTTFKVFPFVEQKIYDGFPSRRDENLMLDFHELNWDDRWPVVQSFEDVRYKELGERLIYFHSPESIPQERQKIWRQNIQTKLHLTDPDCEWLTAPKAITQAESMITKNEGTKKTLLEGHLRYYKSICEGN